MPGSSEPTEAERTFAWLFSVFYVTLMAVVAGLFAVLVTGWLLEERSPGLGALLGLAVLGMTPHAARLVAGSLAETRGLPAGRRLLKILATIHG